MLVAICIDREKSWMSHGYGDLAGNQGPSRKRPDLALHQASPETEHEGIDDEDVDQRTVVDSAPPRKPGSETEQREPKDRQSRVESHEQTMRWVCLDVIPPSGKISLLCKHLGAYG